VLRLLITGVIALLPVGAMVALVWAAIAAMRRSRRRHASGAGTAPDSDSTPGEDDR
jgi:O-antigen ligase